MEKEHYKRRGLATANTQTGAGLLLS